MIIKYNFITVGREKTKTELIICVLEKNNILETFSLLRCCRKENIMDVFTVDIELCNLHPVCVYCNSLILPALNGKLTDKVRLADKINFFLLLFVFVRCKQRPASKFVGFRKRHAPQRGVSGIVNIISCECN